MVFQLLVDARDDSLLHLMIGGSQSYLWKKVALTQWNEQSLYSILAFVTTSKTRLLSMASKACLDGYMQEFKSMLVRLAWWLTTQSI